MNRVRSDGQRELRAGILLDVCEVAGWRRVVLQRVLADPSVEIALVIEDGSSKSDPRSLASWAARSCWKMIDALEVRISRRLIHRMLTKANCFAPERLDHRSVGIAELGLDRPRVRMDEVDAIRGAGLDVILNLSGQTVRVPPANVSRLGTWSLRTAGGSHDAVSPLAFWEFYRNQSITEIRVLSQCDDSGDVKIVGAARYCTFRWLWSVNAILMGLEASLLLLDLMHRAKDGIDRGEERKWPLQRRVDLGGDQRERGLFHAPVVMASSVFRVVAKLAQRSLFEDRWRLLLMEATPQAAITAGPVVIQSPPDRYWADPFAIRRNGKCYVFFEEYFYAKHRGVISYIELDSLNEAKRTTSHVSHCVIDQPYHLSYPFLFVHKGDLFMIPETSANKSIDIWHATDFPNIWRKHRTIFEGISAADNSLLEWNGIWWLFTNIDRNGLNNHSKELHVFYAEDPLDGPWLPHVGNPVLIDCTSARMAGGFLRSLDGRPIRCGQVQGKRYGESVTYNLVSELSETRYAETPLIPFNSTPTTPGARTHHVAYRDGLLVADECLITTKLGRWLG